MTPFIQLTCGGVDDPIRHTVSWAGTPEADPVVPLPEPQAAASPVSAAAAGMATAARLSLTACSLRVAVAHAGGPCLTGARRAARRGLAPYDTSSAPRARGVPAN